MENLYTIAMQQNVDYIMEGVMRVNSYQSMIDQLIQDYYSEALYISLKPQSTIDLILKSNI